MLKYRYNAAEKFRIQSINALKKERERIIEGADENKIGKDDNNDINKFTQGNMSKTHVTTNSKDKWMMTTYTNTGEDIDQKMEQIFAEQKKAMLKIKQKQRLDIQALIKSQIDREITEKKN